MHYTNAPFILREDFKDTEDLGGFFSGWDEKEKKYDPETWLYERAPAKKVAMQPGACAKRAGMARRGGEAANPTIFDHGSDSAASALRLPGAEATFLALHAGDGGTLLRHPAGFFSKPQKLSPPLPAAIRRRPSAMPWAGRNIPRACRSSAPRRSCNCCWEISGGRAAAFSPCAGTLRFRAPRIFPRCTTFFPAICRCRFSTADTYHLEDYIEEAQSANRLVGQFR